MSEEEVQAILGKALLGFQLGLWLWQFLKLMPVGALLKGVVGWLLRPLGLSPSYTRLHSLQGRIFKEVRYFQILEEPLRRTPRRQCDYDEIHLWYLGMDFHLQRRGTDRNMLFVNGIMCYYITHTIWNELAHISGIVAFARVNVPNAVFLENYKEIWEGIATGRDMTFEQVLDHIILRDMIVRRIAGSSMLLPVDLSVSEEKILKVLNFGGLLLQMKKVYWLIPVLLSFISTVLEFCTPLRVWIYGKINFFFCSAMHLIFDPRPRSMRSQIYALGKYVENLKPSNDIELKVIRGHITAIIAGGAKVQAPPVPLFSLEVAEGGLTRVRSYTLPEGATEEIFNYGNIFIRCTFFEDRQSCNIQATTFADFSVGCSNRDCFLWILTLVSSIANHGSGSLKCYGPHRKVCVRGLQETLSNLVANYGNNIPSVYEMELDNVIVY